MTLCHKAFAFHWVGFASQLKPLLEQALATSDPMPLQMFVLAHQTDCRDPYEGNPLDETSWKALENLGVQTWADFALTVFYDPVADFGLQEEWLHLEGQLPAPARQALLGCVVGPASSPFDPGLMGAYFQTPDMVDQSLEILQKLRNPELKPFLEFLKSLSVTRFGMYVTF